MDLNPSSSGNIQFNRYLFNSRCQDVSETLEDFAKELIRLGNAINADENQIVDRFIAGLSNDNSRMSILNHGEVSLHMALSLAKENLHETVLYTEHVPVTSVDGQSYQVIVMPSQDLPATITDDPTKDETVDEDFNQAKFPIGDANEGHMNYSKTVVPDSFAKKNAAKREERQPSSCTLCDFKCITKVLMKLHYKTVHGNSVPTEFDTEKCSECRVPFLTKAAMETHLVMVHNHSKEDVMKKRLDNILEVPPTEDTDNVEEKEEIQYICEVCYVNCGTYNHLLKHLHHYHKGFSWHMCPECYYRAPSIEMIQSHVKKCHNDSKKFRCMLCNTTFNTKGALTRHTLKEHKGHKIFMCDTCGKKFQTDKTLAAHIKVVHNQIKPFECTECDYKAGQKASLIAHVTSVHKNSRPYVCELCAYKTASQSTLTAHKKMVHMRERPFVCETCGRRFAAKAGMENHILLIHEKAMPFSCDQCNKRFKRKADLVNHVRCFHQGQYFVCVHCNNTFHSQRNLERHIAVVHEQKKAFQCDFCAMTFTRKERLKQHLTNECTQSAIIIKAEGENSVQQNYTIQVQTFSDQHGETGLQTHQIHITDQ